MSTNVSLETLNIPKNAKYFCKVCMYIHQFSADYFRRVRVRIEPALYSNCRVVVLCPTARWELQLTSHTDLTIHFTFVGYMISCFYFGLYYLQLIISLLSLRNLPCYEYLPRIAKKPLITRHSFLFHQYCLHTD